MQTHSEAHKTSFFKRSLFIKIVISVLAVQILGALPAFTSMESLNSWFVTLEKPFFNPPSWLFGPAWSTLFLLMGISFGIVWHKMVNSSNPIEIKQAKKGLGIFVSHMGLNMAWTLLFFGLQMPGLALIEIIVLWIFILIIILQFKKVSKLSAWLLVPYILWVTFASVLNASIVYLN